MSEEHARLLEEMFRASPDVLVVVDAHGTIEMVSPAVQRLFGYAPEELTGRPVETLLPEGVREIHARHRQGFVREPEGRPMGVGLDLLGRHKEGRVFPVDVSLVPTRVDGRLRVGAFVREVSDRRRGEDLLRFVNEISRGVISGEPTPELLQMTAARARMLVGAVSSWISVQSPDRDVMVVAAADGEAAELLSGAVVPASISLAARAMLRGETVVVADMAAEPDVLAEARAAGFAAGVYVPMLAEDGPVGSLVVARRRGQAPFDAGQVAATEVFASAAAIVLALGAARGALERMRISSEHERIARDLHDTVIQRLFGLGMRLQAAERLADPVVGERIRSTVDSIDDVIREIRETIFDLNRPAAADGRPNLRGHMRDIVGDSTESLGFKPRLAFRGPVEAVIDEELYGPLGAVLREALSNAGRHAKARAVDVVLDVSEGWVTLSVSDDGVGFSPGPAAGHGLENMQARALQLGGEFTVLPRQPAGTLVQWRVPLERAG
ncbi:MAG TPA: PAS domain S-box protein [Acidimicrobiales bacterium]|nr:PAS domain S-box protein [Acidimicrobiales bacterium]